MKHLALIAISAFAPTLFPRILTLQDSELLRQDYIVPISDERLDYIRGRVAYDADSPASKERLLQLLDEELHVSMPEWFSTRMNYAIAHGETPVLLGKQLFAFHDGEYINIIRHRTERHHVIFAGSEWEISVDARQHELMIGHLYGRSDYYAAKKTGEALLVIADVPSYPIASIDADGDVVWRSNVFLALGYSRRVDLEVFETDNDLICFAATDREFAIQSFSKHDGEVHFWWSSSTVENGLTRE